MPIMRIHYCKALKKTGKPIIVYNVITGKQITTANIEGFGHWRVKYGNAEGAEKRRGATTILEVW